jgi:hypothetical protein
MAPARASDYSSDPYPENYDPFDPPLDPIEMHSYSPRERNTSRPDISPASSYISSFHNVQGYTPLDTPSPAAAPSPQIPRKSVGSASVTSLGAAISKYKTDPDTERLVERRSREIAHWQIHWQTPALMVGLFILGVVGALAHHLFYKHLDGKPATDQLLMVRYGTALAFWTKATLVGSVVLSYRQRIWQTVRKKAMTMSALDGLFAATEDPLAFTKWEMIRNAKLATVMAVASWYVGSFCFAAR